MSNNQTKLRSAISESVTQWLMNGDPSIRWQVMRDLLSAPERAIKRERQNVARQGWGARLLSRQDPEGTWAHGRSSDGLYTPKWISTTYTMLTLRDFGLPSTNRQARRACRLLVDGGLQPDGGVSYGTWAKWTRRGETCISGMILSILSHFEFNDDRLHTIAQHLLHEQMPDGGWNCRRQNGATHSSVHTTISVLEGLRLYELHTGRRVSAIRDAQHRGREFLLVHRLFRSHRTGEVIKPIFTRFTFPPRWHYDILRALDHFQAVNASCDPRMADAIDIVRKNRQSDGRWLMQHSYKGKTYFTIEQVGTPSRWNTLRALRVLKWWEAGTS